MRPIPGRWRAAALAAAITAWAAIAFLPLLGGFFVSDDLVPLVLFDLWRQEGRLWETLASKFWNGLDAGENHFYRPLSYLSLGVNYAMSGADPAGWLWVNVACHALCAALVADIVLRQLGRREASAVTAALLGAACFLFALPAAEIVGWASGRFDAFATLFTLGSCALFLRSRRAFDAACMLSLASAAAAMLSKESAAILPFALWFLAWGRLSAQGSGHWIAQAAGALRAVWPWLALSLAYLGLRYAVFGDPLRVYAHSRPLTSLLSGPYWHELVDGFPPWFVQQFPNDGARALLLVLAALQAALLLWAIAGRHAVRPALLAAGAAMAMTVLLLMPHQGRMPPDGIGSRLFYQSAAFYGVLVGLGAAATRVPKSFWAVALALVALQAQTQWMFLERWKAVHRDLRDIAAATLKLHGELAAGDYAIVLLAEGRDSVPFARHMQAGYILPPLQPRVLSDRLLVQVYDEIPELGAKVADALVTTLRERSVFDWLKGTRIRREGVEFPNRILCWSSARHALVPLDVAPGPSPEAWVKAIRAQLAASDCDRRFPARSAGE